MPIDRISNEFAKAPWAPGMANSYRAKRDNSMRGDPSPTPC